MDLPKPSNDVVPFDPDLAPTSEQNRLAAESEGLKWDPKSNYFLDEDGGMIRDQFGQRL